jgi:hypothetical protein
LFRKIYKNFQAYTTLEWTKKQLFASWLMLRKNSRLYPESTKKKIRELDERVMDENLEQLQSTVQTVVEAAKRFR